jgi:hypothetical protein
MSTQWGVRGVNRGSVTVSSVTVTLTAVHRHRRKHQSIQYIILSGDGGTVIIPNSYNKKKLYRNGGIERAVYTLALHPCSLSGKSDFHRPSVTAPFYKAFWQTVSVTPLRVSVTTQCESASIRRFRCIGQTFRRKILPPCVFGKQTHCGIWLVADQVGPSRSPRCGSGRPATTSRSRP